eukprot:scaffold7067_cov245-Pinguiococcus_pyrenoidosus.AAC.12
MPPVPQAKCGLPYTSSTNRSGHTPKKRSSRGYGEGFSSATRSSPGCSTSSPPLRASSACMLAGQATTPQGTLPRTPRKSLPLCERADDHQRHPQPLDRRGAKTGV